MAVFTRTGISNTSFTCRSTKGRPSLAPKSMSPLMTGSKLLTISALFTIVLPNAPMTLAVSLTADQWLPASVTVPVDGSIEIAPAAFDLNETNPGTSVKNNLPNNCSSWRPSSSVTDKLVTPCATSLPPRRACVVLSTRLPCATTMLLISATYTLVLVSVRVIGTCDVAPANAPVTRTAPLPCAVKIAPLMDATALSDESSQKDTDLDGSSTLWLLVNCIIRFIRAC